MRAALLQLTSSDNPEENIGVVLSMIREAVQGGAGFVLTPEVTNCVSGSRTRQKSVLRPEDDDPMLAAMREAAKVLKIWISVGSLALKSDDPAGRFVNRQFLLSPEGEIAAYYDKIHMFDVELSAAETYRESDGYRPGNRAVVASTSFAKVGLTICYDVRFAYLHRSLAQAGAQILTVPSAFSPISGAAHWHALLQARAIETGCYVLAPAQTGTHSASRGPTRTTYGHSLAVSPWGEILLDAGTDAGVSFVDLDMEMVAKARKRIPALTHDRHFDGP
ncbi:MAG: carbon-nitrogen hydrolase family protein [Paracoccaceae bacterium]